MIIVFTLGNKGLYLFMPLHFLLEGRKIFGREFYFFECLSRFLFTLETIYYNYFATSIYSRHFDHGQNVKKCNGNFGNFPSFGVTLSKYFQLWENISCVLPPSRENISCVLPPRREIISYVLPPDKKIDEFVKYEMSSRMMEI